MGSNEKSRVKDDGEPSKPAKRQRKLGFSTDVGVEPSSCITVRLVSSAEEMQEGSRTDSVASGFPPDFAERFFGEEGKIYGYKDVKIIIWLHALSFHAYVDIRYSKKSQGSGQGKQKMTDLQKVFKEVFGAGLVEERDTFVQSLSSNNNLIDVIHHSGKRLASWRMIGQSWIKIDETCDVDKEILLMDLSASQIKEWHSRLTPIVLMFIEAGRPIEQQDPRWEVYVNLEKRPCEPGSPWKVVGFCTVYNFFKYPDSTRLRVSQIMVLPPYQGKQNGLYLLEAVYKTALQRNCYDVTMEEPSESLQELRDCMDALRILSFEPANTELQLLLKRLGADSKMHNDCGIFEEWLPSHNLVEAVRKNFKISKRQLQRCWEVLLSLHLSKTDMEAQGMLRNLVTWRLKVELFGKPKSTKVSDNKQIIDTENEYDSSKTFVMCKVKPSLQGATEGDREVQKLVEETLEVDGETDAEKELKEFIEERKEEIERVVAKVIQLSKSPAQN